jgi:nucleoside recognition membrane protein YjiH
MNPYDKHVMDIMGNKTHFNATLRVHLTVLHVSFILCFLLFLFFPVDNKSSAHVKALASFFPVCDRNVAPGSTARENITTM